MELQPLSLTELITAGILLVALEVFLFSFFIIWFGFASIVVGVLTHFYQFNSLTEQLGVIAVFSLLLFFALSKPLKEKLMRPKESLSEEKSRIGTVKNGKVSFEGTLWGFRCDEVLSEGDRVEVLGREGNTLSVKLTSSR